MELLAIFGGILLVALLILIGGITLIVLTVGGIMAVVKGIVSFFKDDKKE